MRFGIKAVVFGAWLLVSQDNALRCIYGFSSVPFFHNTPRQLQQQQLQQRQRQHQSWLSIGGASVTTTPATTDSMTEAKNENEEGNEASSSPMATDTDTATDTATTTFMPVTSFDDGRSPFQITTPIYYVNDKPHIGHAYTSTACDVMARFHRLSGREVFFLTGTDEHGQKVEQSAATKGYESPQAFVDEMSRSFVDLLDRLDISHDCFIRTTSDDHKASVQHLWRTLVSKGYIYKGTYSGWYSIRDECFYNESELIDGKAPTGAEVEWVAKEESYFFKLSAFEDKLLELYEQQPEMIAPASRRNEVVSFVKGGLRDLSVSRTSFTWGVPVPDQDESDDSDSEQHIMYVWIDALANYMTALGYPHNGDGSDFAKYWPAGLHCVGKDILRFHAVYWPAFLMAADLPLPRRVYAHGWWTKDGEKISKSLGNVIDPVDLVTRFGVDAVRFFFMSEIPFGNDGDYSEMTLIQKCNAHLANELGNLAHRACTLTYKNCDGVVPSSMTPYTEDDDRLLATARGVRDEAAGHISRQEIHKYATTLITLVKDANKYIDVQAPWALAKTDPERMQTVLYVLLETLRHALILYQPLIPQSTQTLLDQLSVPSDERTFAHLESSPLRPGTPMEAPQIVLSRFELPEDTKEQQQQKQQQQQQKQKQQQQPQQEKPNKKAPPAAPVTIDISSLDIRVGVIQKVWEHEEADRLFCEEIDIGEETGPRQIASGLRDHYSLEEMEGQRVLVLANLKPRKLVGFASHGMVLCASTPPSSSSNDDGRVEFVVPPADAAVGERVFVDDFPGEAATENQVQKKKMLDHIFPDLKTNDEGVATFRGLPLLTSAGPCRAQSGLANADVS